MEHGSRDCAFIMSFEAEFYQSGSKETATVPFLNMMYHGIWDFWIVGFLPEISVFLIWYWLELLGD